MIIIHAIDPLETERLSAVCIGNFDGVHTAHKQILQQTRQEAINMNGISVVISFSKHPQAVLHPQNKHFGLLCSEEDKIKRIADMGIDDYISLNFNQEMAETSYLDFIRTLKNKLNLHTLVMGGNHHFGKGKGGNLSAIQAAAATENINIALVDDIYINQEKVSSSAIRAKILKGDFAGANAMLGFQYSLTAYNAGSWTKYTRFMPLNNQAILPPAHKQYTISIDNTITTAHTDGFYIYIESAECHQKEKVIISFLN